MMDRKRPQATEDTRSLEKTEADEIEAIRESADTARQPVRETLDEPVEPRLAVEGMPDVPGLDDNSQQDNPPGWDEARKVADERTVGSDPEPREDDTGKTQGQAAAFRDGEAAGPTEAEVQVRPAGPEATRDGEEDWDEVDQAADESFPASDPPATY